jgi:hypothetical protein
MFAAASRRQDLLMDESSFAPASKTATASNTAPNLLTERARVVMPEGWVLERVVAATFLKSGLCRPGMALLRNEQGQRVVVKVSGPACSVDTVTDLPSAMQ